MIAKMQHVNVGMIGLGNVGSGTLAVLADNADQIALKLGFKLRVTAVCSRSVEAKKLPASLGAVYRTSDWRQVVAHPEVDIVAELVGGTTVAAEIIDGAIAHKKSVVTANKELMASCGSEIWDRAIHAGINLAMEASVAGGIPIHAVLREGISGDRVVALYGILNGTSNYILTEMEQRGAAFDEVLAEAQRLGYAEAEPSADVDGFDARSKRSEEHTSELQSPCNLVCRLLLEKKKSHTVLRFIALHRTDVLRLLAIRTRRTRELCYPRLFLLLCLTVSLPPPLRTRYCTAHEAD